MDQLTIATHNTKMSLWAQRIRACKASGQTVIKWCEDHEVDRRRYYYWHRKLKREAFEGLPEAVKKNAVTCSPVAKPAFVEITASEEAIISCDAQAQVLLHVGSLSLEILEGADSQTIKNTLEAIKTLC